PGALADVADPEVAGFTIDAAAPRIPQAERPDLLPIGLMVLKWIALGNGIRFAAIHINAQNLTEKSGAVLPIADGAVDIVSPTAIARGDVEIAIGAETEPAAVVVGFGLVIRQQNRAALGVRCDRGVRIAHGLVTGDFGVA